MNTKTLKLIFLSVFSTLMTTGVGFAQNVPPPPPGSMPSSMPMRPYHDPLSNLNLTAEQQTKINHIRKQFREKAQKNREKEHQQIQAVLTAEQQKQFKMEMEQHQKWMPQKTMPIQEK